MLDRCKKMRSIHFCWTSLPCTKVRFSREVACLFAVFPSSRNCWNWGLWSLFLGWQVLEGLWNENSGPMGAPVLCHKPGSNVHRVINRNVLCDIRIKHVLMELETFCLWGDRTDIHIWQTVLFLWKTARFKLFGVSSCGAPFCLLFVRLANTGHSSSHKGYDDQYTVSVHWIVHFCWVVDS